MGSSFFSILEALLLISALTMDAFAASLAYGTKDIAVPLRSASVITLICSGMLAASLLAGSMLGQLIPPKLAHQFSFFLLFALGVEKLFDSSVKAYIRKQPQLKLHFSARSINFVLTVYADAEAADIDHSKSLSAREAAFLATALSLDGLAAGFGSAFLGNLWLPISLSLLLTPLAIYGGCALGRKLSSLVNTDLSWASGALFIILAILKL